MKRFVIAYIALLVLTLAVPVLVCLVSKAPEENSSLVNIFQGVITLTDSVQLPR